MILTIRTDKPEAELGLFEGCAKIDYVVWQADRHLAETIHQKIEEMLQKQHKSWENLEGIVCFQGPGSFTGLRIGLTVGNALAFSLEIPIVAVQGEDWIRFGLERLMQGENDVQATPFYGADAHITPQKK